MDGTGFDGDGTPEPVRRKVAASDARVRVVRFTRNYGQEAAVEALYLNARGRWLIQMDGDLQHPPEEIPRLIAKKDEGYDVVYGVRQKRQDAMFRVVASRAMQWTMRSMMEVELPEDVSTFRLMSAPIARLVATLPERRKFFSALLVWSGARIGTVNVSHAPRNAGSTHYGFTKLLNHTFDLIVGFSSKPLRYIVTLGFVFAHVGLALGLWVIARKLLWDYGILGWPSLFAAVVILGRNAAHRHERNRRVHRSASTCRRRPAPLQASPSASNFDPVQAPKTSGGLACRSRWTRMLPAARASVPACRARARRPRPAPCVRVRACVRACACARACPQGGRLVSRLVSASWSSAAGSISAAVAAFAPRGAAGSSVVGADANRRAVAVAHCDEFAEVSTGDVEGLCDLVRRARCDAITTTGSEVSLKATASVAARLGLPFYADPETVRRCQDKDAMRAAYRAAGLAVPGFARCEHVEEALAFARGRAFPMVVKPSRGWGQRGVARVEDEGELPRAFDEARAHSASAGLPVAIVEEWLEGREYSVNGWIEDGVLASYCVTERLTVPGRRPLGVMLAEVYPSGLSPEDETRVVREARLGAAALGHTRGACYSQVGFGPRGAFLFETAARLGGGFDADVTRLASGVDLYDRLLGVALGDAALERQGVVAPSYGGAIAKFLVAAPGTVRAVRGLDEARGLAGIADAEVFVPVGGQVFPLVDSAKRAAYALAHGASREEATARADAALDRLSIDTGSEPCDEATA